MPSTTSNRTPTGSPVVTKIMSSPTVTLEEIWPFPKAGPRKSSNKGKRKGSTKILTDTRVKNKIIEEALKQREEKEIKAFRSISASQRKRNLLNPVRLNKSKKQKNNEVPSESDTNEEIDCNSTTEDDDDSVGFDLLICEDKKPQINDYVVVKTETKKENFILRWHCRRS